MGSWCWSSASSLTRGEAGEALAVVGPPVRLGVVASFIVWTPVWWRVDSSGDQTTPVVTRRQHTRARRCANGVVSAACRVAVRTPQ